MKQANITLALSKEHHVHLKNVTPIEVILLVAEHHKNNGGNPVTVDTSSIKETGHFVEEEVLIDEDKIVTENGTKKIVTEKVKSTKKVWASDKRTVDQEIDRLRGKYAGSKIKAMLIEVRDFPDDFDKAIERGSKLVLGGDNKLASAKL